MLSMGWMVMVIFKTLLLLYALGRMSQGELGIGQLAVPLRGGRNLAVNGAGWRRLMWPCSAAIQLRLMWPCSAAIQPRPAMALVRGERKDLGKVLDFVAELRVYIVHRVVVVVVWALRGHNDFVY